MNRPTKKPPRRYAEGTEVPAEKSRAELERLLERAGATGFASSWDHETGVARLLFRIGGRMVRLEVLRPDREEFRGRLGRGRTVADMVEAEHRRRWRAQVLLVKAKLEMIAGGASTLEREFFADLLLPDGRTLGEEVLPRLAEAYESGAWRPTLPLLGSGEG